MIPVPELTNYTQRLTAQRYSGRRFFILRTLLATPDTLPAGPTLKGPELPGRSIFVHTLPSAAFNRTANS